ncbi:GNAT family N-acetyltransferase [Lederbergia wuyishanensis]|uniref:Ribosomal protein S18 acetylase RimI-like enzyme n=1 Tax=Lederbergia wuyishanensis TaxID=1347903 RepID=A0ABU0D4C7_9BACI|nr:GNAT family N-acetyltransferase [Lederbergia wuyishanensis]MCJ8008146.1 GNAT family N-acetyltransferase [Lederbergia wuyishanensis]MDQ0343266.1 ribosomal protein S18 acetylase RimI-like enzyme [Lederbergia wuyishanensis]
MERIKNPSIKLKRHLDYQEYVDIKSLMKYCVEKDNVALKLELDYKLSKPLDKSEDLNKINEFMFYDEGTLIGYIGICQFGGETLEVNGMVHPEYRRLGIFSRLFSLVKDEWYKRKSQDMYLLSDNNSLPGLEFIKRTGAYYDNSEYDMFLKGDLRRGSDLNELRLRKAINKDAKEIARQNAVYFDIDPKKVGLILPEEEANRGVDIYIAEFNNTIIGKVHLEVHDGIGGIYGLGVLPEYRGNGYGKEILIKSVQLLRAKQVNEVMLQVSVKNKSALNLYKSCGFEVVSTMDYYKLRKEINSLP